MNNKWIGWRQGHLGVWSLAHLTSDGYVTRCGIELGDTVTAPRNLVKCHKCQEIAKTEQAGKPRTHKSTPQNAVAPDTPRWVEGAAENVADDLNKGFDRTDRYIYSYEQTQKALIHFRQDQIEKLDEELESRFLALTSEEQEKYLDDPERDRVQEARDEAADMAFEAARGN